MYKVLNEGTNIRIAAKIYCISRETLRRWVTKETKKAEAGRKRVLKDEEELITVALEKCSTLAWLFGTEEIKLMIKTCFGQIGKENCTQG